VGAEAAARLLAPISIDSIMLFQQGGWSADRLLLLTVQRMNDVFNAPTAGGPTPAHTPDFEAFADLAERLERLREAGLEGVNWVRPEHEPAPPGPVVPEGRGRVDATGGLPGRRQERIPPSSDLSSNCRT
jgi:hypothetical protein